jgi:hypothetical protein
MSAYTYCTMFYICAFYTHIQLYEACAVCGQFTVRTSMRMRAPGILLFRERVVNVPYSLVYVDAPIATVALLTPSAVTSQSTSGNLYASWHISATPTGLLGSFCCVCVAMQQASSSVNKLQQYRQITFAMAHTTQCYKLCQRAQASRRKHAKPRYTAQN